jgi:hypothetical protein
MKINPQNSPLFAAGQAKWDAFVAGYSGPYDLSAAVYAGMNQKVQFVCPTHGYMQMDAKNLMSGRECQKCSFDARKGKPRVTQNKMLARFQSQHGGRYDYSQTVYKGQQSPVTIICRTHGAFAQKPEFHWTGSGCPKCFHEDRRGASQRDTLDTFRGKLIKVFGSRFDVSDVEYTNSQADIQVRCIEHDRLCDTRPNWLLNGQNPCPKCNHTASKGEDSLYQHVAKFTAAARRDRTILKPRELDIYLPEHRLAIEYCGEYWHSAGSKDEERAARKKHIQKYRDCKAQGIRLITLWESEWKEHNYAVRRLLRNAVGKSKGKLMARKCELKKVTTQEARPFYDRYHPQGGAGYGEHYALFWKGKMVACMRFVLGANDRGAGAQNRTWTLGRYATRITVAGAASRLFKAFLAEVSPPEVKSFSDNRFFEGGMYEQLGFRMEEEVPEDYVVWSPKLGILPKSHYQRRVLPQRLREHGLDEAFDPATDPRTEAEMTYLMGAQRLFDCGKKRWVWTPQE